MLNQSQTTKELLLIIKGGCSGMDPDRSALLGASAAKRNDTLHASKEPEEGDSNSSTHSSTHSSAAPHRRARGGREAGAEEGDDDAARGELLARGSKAVPGATENGVSLDDLDFDNLDFGRQRSREGESNHSGNGEQNGGETRDELEEFLSCLGGLEDFRRMLETDTELRSVCSQESDLRAYADSQQRELAKAETSAIEAYVAESDAVSALGDEMMQCDSTLAKLEELLLRFQVDIGGIGAEIRELQNDCLHHQIKLENRRKLEAEIGRFIDGMQIAESTKSALLNHEVDDVYLEYLIRFSQHLSFMENNRLLTNGTEVAAYEEAELAATKIRAVAVDKVHKFVTKSIENMAAMATSARGNDLILGPNGVIRKLHKSLIGFSYFFQFLFKHAPEVANEVREEYASTMAKIYAAHFRIIFAQAARRQFVLASKNDLIGVEESKQRGFFSGRKTIKNKASVFALGQRTHLADTIGQPPDRTAEQLLLEGDTSAFAAFTSLIGNATKTSEGAGLPNNPVNDRQSFELLFRAILWDTMQAVTDEMSFVQDFFLGTFDDDVLAQLFAGPLVQLQHDWLEKYVSGTHDAIGVLICLVHVQLYRQIMRKRLVFALDAFLAASHAKLAARFFHLCSLNTESIHNATANASSISTGDVRAHYMARRYAEFVSSVTHLCRQSVSAGERKFVDKVMRTLVSIREAMQRLLTALAVCQTRDKRKQTIFHINNLDLIVAILQEHDPSKSSSAGPTAVDDSANGEPETPNAKPPKRDRLSIELQHFQQLLDGKIRALARIELDHRFSDLMDFAWQHRPSDDSSSVSDAPSTSEHEVENLLKNFHDSWHAALDDLQSSLMSDFSNFECGARLQQIMLRELADAYSVLGHVIRTQFKRLRTSKFFVPEATVEAEMAKRSSGFS